MVPLLKNKTIWKMTPKCFHLNNEDMEATWKSGSIIFTALKAPRKIMGRAKSPLKANNSVTQCNLRGITHNFIKAPLIKVTLLKVKMTNYPTECTHDLMSLSNIRKQ